MKVSQSQVNGWLKDPVTQAFIQAIESTRDSLIKACGDGGCRAPNDTIERMYSFYQGKIEAAKYLCSPVIVMTDSELIHTEAEQEESTHD